jgi:hypothetical protein
LNYLFDAGISFFDLHVLQLFKGYFSFMHLFNAINATAFTPNKHKEKTGHTLVMNNTRGLDPNYNSDGRYIGPTKTVNVPNGDGEPIKKVIPEEGHVKNNVWGDPIGYDKNGNRVGSLPKPTK